MHLVFDIFQGIGIAAAVGIRPFLPALVAGALAAGNVEIHFNHTNYSFLQSAPFLLVLVVLVIVLAFVERRFGHDRLEQPPARRRARACAFAARRAAVRRLAGPRPLRHLAGLDRRGRLRARRRCSPPGRCSRGCAAGSTSEAAAAVPLYAEALALLLAALSVVAPPVGLIGLLALLWLLFAGRRREGQKYAGLRILR